MNYFFNKSINTFKSNFKYKTFYSKRVRNRKEQGLISTRTARFFFTQSRTIGEVKNMN